MKYLKKKVFGMVERDTLQSINIAYIQRIERVEEKMFKSLVVRQK